jgi:putative hydrolase of the HAD superfamily
LKFGKSRYPTRQRKKFQSIWDFDKNAEETLHELYALHRLNEIGLTSATSFIETYTANNHKLWREYHLGNITKETLRHARFNQTFLDLGVHPDVIPYGFEDAYVQLCPTKTNLFPNAHETLTYLAGKYTLHLISNGFKESQTVKINGTGIGKYFQNVVVSEMVGVNKPDKAIFQYALDLAGATKAESLMIGDSLEADVMGALDFGMDAIFFNPFNTEKPEGVPVQINDLKELLALL